MTLFGPDLSSFQNGVDAGVLDADFLIAKATEGTYYTDANYDGWRRQAAGRRLPFIWYHFLSGEDAADQVAHTAAHIGDRTLPGMLDVEPEGSFSPTLAQVLAYADAAAAAGLNLRLIYLPRWYWNELGRPDLSPLAARGLALVSSAYGPGTGYPGDDAAGWLGYGGMEPTVYQYTNAAPVQGRPVDMNAVRGELADLITLLEGTASVPQIPPSISAKWTDLAGEFPPGAEYTDEVALIWADAGARAAALYAQQALGEIRAVRAQLAAAQTPPAVPPVDVDALAAALAPRLQAAADAGTPHDVTAQDIAHATVMYLANTIQAGATATPATTP